MKSKELVVLLIVALSLFFSSVFNSCNNIKIPSIGSYEIVKEKVSVNLKYKAVKLKVNVGATEEYTYKLIIISKKEQPTNNSHAVFVSYNDFDFYWFGNNLEVKIIGDKKIFIQQKTYKGINILYETS